MTYRQPIQEWKERRPILVMISGLLAPSMNLRFYVHFVSHAFSPVSRIFGHSTSVLATDMTTPHRWQKISATCKLPWVGRLDNCKLWCMWCQTSCGKALKLDMASSLLQWRLSPEYKAYIIRQVAVPPSSRFWIRLFRKWDFCTLLQNIDIISWWKVGFLFIFYTFPIA